MTGKVLKLIRNLTVRRDGQGVIEYLFIVSLIAVLLILSLTAVGLAVSNFFTSLTNYISSLY